MDTDATIVEAETGELERYEPQPSTSLFLTNDPDMFLTKASEAATALARVIRERKLYTTIRGRDHVHVEGWTLLGSLLGVFPFTEWTRPIDDGWEARVVARTRAGELVGAAESMCLRTESKWRNADGYAVRSMAATRATSKALRLPLGFIMELAGFDATPADEMPADTVAPAPAAREDSGKIPAEIRPTKAQGAHIRELLDELTVRHPDTDWPAAAREFVGVPREMLTRTIAAQLIRWLEKIAREGEA